MLAMVLKLALLIVEYFNVRYIFFKSNLSTVQKGLLHCNKSTFLQLLPHREKRKSMKTLIIASRR